ncbi:hypothetical protein AVEN_117718-1 [Araneus ventricosus]|uniref:Uncharacterized protein n=1 Tax=Araneus ventricosus TaxID=182803 RepID=A0A4Y2PYL9_ARAVE|nr:hypothetical protein AVEN_117718-1 [Araneus ventricosus]
MAIACERAHFSYLWTIENVPQLTYIDLRSPVFVANSISQKAWYLKISKNQVFCCSLEIDEHTLHRDDDLLQFPEDRGIPMIDIEFSLLAADGSPLISKSSDESELPVKLFPQG